MRLLLFLLFAAPAVAQVSFTSSNLPIVLIDTDGQQIPDEPKITARMQVIDNGPGQRNAVTDAPTDYDGWIGIERRGSTSQAFFPKQQYGVETRDAAGDGLDVSLLGFPEEEDWILQAPYSDKSLMRNVLAYGLARRMGRYASRTRFCEVVLNGEYQGVYVLMEKIKRDDHRVDINNLKENETSGDDLTGGYIFKLDKTTGSDPVGGWTSPYAAPANPSRSIRYLFDDPDADDIQPEQAAYIEGIMAAFETAVDAADEDPATGYPAIIDVGSFVDVFLVTEVGKNIDGYRLSSFFHKDKDSNDPLLHAGPVWDYNLAFGNANYYGGDDPTRFQVHWSEPSDAYQTPFWWGALSEGDAFRRALRERWAGLRTGPLHTDSLMAQIDADAARLDEAQARNFQRWPVLGEYVWPNAPGYENRDTYAAEVEYLKSWLRLRMTWLDGTFLGGTSVEPGADGPFALSAPWPNPSRGDVRLSLTLATPADVTVDVLDVRGRRVARAWDGPATDGAQVTVDGAALSAGVYLVRATTARESASRRIVVMR